VSLLAHAFSCLGSQQHIAKQYACTQENTEIRRETQEVAIFTFRLSASNI
jgi:hypothetical protein